MIVNLLMMVLIDLPIKFTCQRHISGCLLCMTSAVFFFPIDLNNFYCKTFDQCTLFVLKREKRTLSYFHTKFEGDKKQQFFSAIYFVGALVFLPQH